MKKNALISRVMFLGLMASSLIFSGIVSAKILPVLMKQNANKNIETNQPTSSSTVLTEMITITPTIVTATPTLSVAIPITATPIPTRDTRCIVTIYGQTYDVSFLQNSHSGGNVFTCGTDMTTIYQRRHGTNLNLIASYLIGSSGTAPNPQSTAGRGERENDD